MPIVDLTGKEVPKKYFRNYMLWINPDNNHRLDEDGFTNHKKPMTIRFVLGPKVPGQKQERLYILPTEMCLSEDGKTTVEVPMYNLADIVAAGSGNPEAQQKIDSCNDRLRKELNCDEVLTPEWCNKVIRGTRSKFVDVYNQFKEARGQEQNAEEEVPHEAATYEDLTPSEVQYLASAAREVKGSYSRKNTPSEQGGDAQ